MAACLRHSPEEAPRGPRAAGPRPAGAADVSAAGGSGAASGRGRLLRRHRLRAHARPRREEPRDPAVTGGQWKSPPSRYWALNRTLWKTPFLQVWMEMGFQDH